VTENQGALAHQKARVLITRRDSNLSHRCGVASGRELPAISDAAQRTMAEPTVWRPAPPRLVLGQDEVHVWRASLDAPATYLQHLRDTLTPDELAALSVSICSGITIASSRAEASCARS
jgi:hypothetical protein